MDWSNIMFIKLACFFPNQNVSIKEQMKIWSLLVAETKWEQLPLFHWIFIHRWQAKQKSIYWNAISRERGKFKDEGCATARQNNTNSCNVDAYIYFSYYCPTLRQNRWLKSRLIKDRKWYIQHCQYSICWRHKELCAPFTTMDYFSLLVPNMIPTEIDNFHTFVDKLFTVHFS